MLTALSETDNRIAGLEAGADDYLPKPFDPRELILRINNILRRGGPQQTPKVEQIVFGPYTFQIARRELKKGGEALKLTDREQEILAIFAERAGETIPRHELVANDSDVGERTIDVQINRLRRKIEKDPANPVWLQTVRGIGYRLECGIARPATRAHGTEIWQTRTLIARPQPLLACRGAPYGKAFAAVRAVAQALAPLGNAPNLCDAAGTG